jgi:hypothetical protein
MGSEEVMDLDFFSSMPNPAGDTSIHPTASAASVYVKLDGIGNNEDFIIVLKLIDGTTKALYVSNSDIYKGPGTGPSGYTGVVLDNNDGLVVIEQNDYTLDPSITIVGMQIMTQDNGIAGDAIDLNPVVGSAGGSLSSPLTSFAADSNNNGFKVSDIGFVTTQSASLPASLTFIFSIIDADGDTTNPQSLTVSIAATPIAFDANRDGLITYQALATSTAHFDYAGDGFAEQTAWVAAGDALLVYDYNHDGIANNGSEIAFVNYHPDATTDLEGLRFAFDANHDLVFDAQDAQFADFGIWVDKNGDGVTDPGEFQTLAQAGIRGIGLTSDGIANYAVGGDVLVYGQIAVTYSDGSTGLAEDVAFAVATVDATFSEPAAADLLSVVDSLDEHSDAFMQDVTIPDKPMVVSDVIMVVELVENYVAENAFTDEVIGDFQQELALAEIFVSDNIAADSPALESTADALAALDQVDAFLPDDASDGIATVADVVDDFSYTV